jgi:hypothetical protein
MSEYQKIIREAQILASSHYEIVRYIEGRSRDNLEDGGTDFESKLLAIADRRIDLALAQHCIFAETAQYLFFRDADDIALRLSILSNEKIGEYLHVDEHMPYALFPEKSDAFDAYIAGVNADEFHAIFNNNAIDREFVSDFFSGRAAWESIDERRRILAVKYLCRNSGFTTAYKPKGWRFDDFDDYDHAKAFTASYEMADRVPVRSDWANALTELYAELPNDIHGVQGNIDTNRWIATDAQDQDAERKANAEGRFSIFQSVRFYCALAGLKGDDGRIAYLLGSSDISERSAAYRCGKFPAWKIWWCLRKDGTFAFGQFLNNDDVWGSRQKRKIISRYRLNNISNSLKSDFNYGEILEQRMRECPRNFSREELDVYDINIVSNYDNKIDDIIKGMFIIFLLMAVILFKISN